MLSLAKRSLLTHFHILKQLTSAINSPSLIFSPSFFSQRAMVPACIVGEREGNGTWRRQRRNTKFTKSYLTLILV